jgi:hypothetical protein
MMILTVTVPAPDRSLLTLAELRAATGQTTTDNDDALTTLGNGISAAIAAACNIAVAGTTPPTLRAETLSQTERTIECLYPYRLARRPVTAIASVTVDGTALDPTAFEFDPAGYLYRLDNDARVVWSFQKITIVYTAGWATVPDDLKLAASKLAAALWLGGRDPNLRRVQIEGVGLREYWVPPTTDPLISQEIRELLRPYTELPPL